MENDLTFFKILIRYFGASTLVWDEVMDWIYSLPETTQKQ